MDACPSMLDALALACLPQEALIANLASRYRREKSGHLEVVVSADLKRWIAGSFGLEIIPTDNEDYFLHALRGEINRQVRIAVQRLRRRLPLPDTSREVILRRYRLAESVLGPVRRWISPRLADDEAYEDVLVSRGVVAGLINYRIGARTGTKMIYRVRPDAPTSFDFPFRVRTFAHLWLTLTPDFVREAKLVDAVVVNNWRERCHEVHLDEQVIRISWTVPDNARRRV